MFRRSKNRHTALRLPGLHFLRMAATISSNEVRLLDDQPQQKFRIVLKR